MTQQQQSAFASVSNILATLGGSLQSKKIRVFIGYTSTINKLLLVVILLFALAVQQKPANIACEATSSLSESMTTAKCSAALIFYKYGEQAIIPSKTNRFSIQERKAVKKIKIHDQLPIFILFISAVIVYTPRYFWKRTGGNYIESNLLCMIGKLSDQQILNNENINKLTEFLKRSLTTMNCNKYHMFLYFLYQILMIITMYMPYIAHKIFFNDVSMTDLWQAVYDAREELREDILEDYFPTKVGCTFTRFGVSGTVEVLNTLCSISNNLTLQVYVIWLYYITIVMAVASTIDFCSQIFQIFILPATGLNAKSKAFYHSFIKLNYPCLIVEEITEKIYNLQSRAFAKGSEV